MPISPQAPEHGPRPLRPLRRLLLVATCLVLACALSGCDWLFGDDDDAPRQTRPDEPAGAETTTESGPRSPELMPVTPTPPDAAGDGPRPQPPGDAPIELEQRQARFALGPPPSPTYRTAEPIAPRSRALAELVREATPPGAAPVAWSQCLARAAAAYASYHPHEPDIVPPRAFVEYALHWSGCPDSAAAVRLYYTTEHDTGGLADYVERVLAEADGEFTHLGIGRAPGGGTPYRWTWAVLMTRRHYDMDPLARSGPPGGSLPLRFQLEPRLHDPEVLVMPAGEPIIHVDLAEQPNGDWHAQVPLGDVPGEQWLEILATGELGPEVVALFPLYVGKPPPSAWTGLLPPDESWVRTPADAEHLMLRLVNRDRAEHGLPPLVWDDTLAAIARQHSADMRDRGYFGHVSPDGRTLSDRFEAIDYEARYSAENIARNPLVYDAQVGLMESLGHRANILSPRPTRVGIGVAVGQAANGERTFFLTQNFARPVMRPQPSTLRAHMRRAVDEVRHEAGLGALSPSGKLDRIANEAARLAADSGFDGDRVNARISEALGEAGISYRRFRVQYQPVLELEDFDAPGAASERSVSRVGLGVADIAASEDSLAMLATLVLLLER